MFAFGGSTSRLVIGSWLTTYIWKKLPGNELSPFDTEKCVRVQFIDFVSTATCRVSVADKLLHFVKDLPGPTKLVESLMAACLPTACGGIICVTPSEGI